MNVFDRLNKLVEEKEKQELSENDRELLDIAKRALENKQCFFYANQSYVMGMLSFLGVKKEELNLYYYELISPETHQEVFPKERIGISL